MTESTWLITGGCGFIGRRLIAVMRKRSPNVRLRVFDNLTVGDIDALRAVCAVDDRGSALGELPPVEQGVVQFVLGDVRDRQAMEWATRGADAVVHLAANTGVGPSVEDPHADCENNVLGTLNALDGARRCGVKRFIFASSGAPVGEVTPPVHEEIVPHPVSPYGASKLAGEGYCSAYARTFGLETVSLRFGNVYGPGSKHKSSVVAKFIRDAVNEGVLYINGDGTQTRDFIYVDDLVEAILAAVRTPGIAGEIFQIATARETSVGEIAEMMRSKLGLFGFPAPRIVYEAPRVGDVKRNCSDTSKALRVLGWRPSTGVEQGIEATVRWFLEQRAAGSSAGNDASLGKAPRSR